MDGFGSTRHKVFALAIGLAIAVFVVTRMLFFEPASSRIASLRQQKTLETEKKSVLEMIEISLSQVDRHHEHLAKNTDISWLIDVINENAQSSGLSLGSVTPLNAERKGYYIRLPVGIESKCTYRELGEFVSRIESVSPIVKFDRVTAEALTETGPDGETVNLSLVLSTFSPTAE